MIVLHGGASSLPGYLRSAASRHAEVSSSAASAARGPHPQWWGTRAGTGPRRTPAHSPPYPADLPALADISVLIDGLLAIAVFKAYGNRTKDWADLEAMAEAASSTSLG